MFINKAKPLNSLFDVNLFCYVVEYEAKNNKIKSIK